jgi:outer membrane lipoprotein
MGKSALAASTCTLSGLLAGLLMGCASEPLPATVVSGTEQPPFLSLQQDPASYEGRRIVLGGEVLQAKRRADRTEIEVLQLPLNSRNEPTSKRLASQGRFFAYQKDFLDPATIPAGTLITVVGEGKGSVREKLDEMEYSYPVVESEYIKVWPDRPLVGDRPYPYGYGPYDYYGPWYPYYSPYRYPFFYPGPFFRPFPFRPSHFHFRHAPHGPRPPQFRRSR